MKLRELKEFLDQFPDDFEIILASDGEGNSFTRLHDVIQSKFDYDNDELISEGVDDESNCLVFWPD